MTTQTNQPAAAIRTPAAQSLELLQRIADGIEMQNAQLEFLTKSIDHLIQISESAAESSADAAEGLNKFSEAMAAWSSRPQVAGAAPAAPQGQTVVFMAETLSCGIAEDGKPVYKIRGGAYQKFGVRVWGETLPLLGIDAASLKPGPNAFSKPVVALMGEKGPRKVIGLAS